MGPIEELIKELSSYFDFPIYYRFSEEQFSVFAADMIFQSGKLIHYGDENGNNSNSRYIFNIASEMQDYDQEYYRYDEKTGEILYDDDPYFNACDTVDTSTYAWKMFKDMPSQPTVLDN